jgi:hypothetical protein
MSVADSKPLVKSLLRKWFLGMVVIILPRHLAGRGPAEALRLPNAHLGLAAVRRALSLLRTYPLATKGPCELERDALIGREDRQGVTVLR